MIISQTPLRISLAGGGTDLPAYCSKTEGEAVSCAIDKYVFVIIQQRFDSQIHINYARCKEVVSSIDEIKHDLVREACRITGVGDGFEITTLADVPSEGSGLGSSSSLTVGLLNGLYAYRGVQVDAETLARQSCEIELERCGKPIGRQDQYIAAYGGVRRLVFRKDGSVGVEKLSAPPEILRTLEDHLLLYYTGKTRSADTLLGEQGRRMDVNRGHLDQIRALAARARTALESGDTDSIGRLLDENWRLKRQLGSGVSDKDIDAFYDKALAAGALGGKVTGAGGGGFAVLYVPQERQRELKTALKGYRELPIALEHDGSKIIFNLRRHIWR